MASFETGLPAPVTISMSEDLRIAFRFETESGAAIDIAGAGFGAFELALQPADSPLPPLRFPSEGLTLAASGETGLLELVAPMRSCRR